MQVIRLTLLLAASTFAVAQSSEPAQTPWQMQESGTTAGLRGIDSVDGTVAWASGTGGTVLRTIDGGAHWTKCAVPDAATDGATLDFRGIQAFNDQAAIVMASGPGEKSRLYKTTDGCKSWTLLLKNTEQKGFWDAILTDTYDNDLVLLGDPVGGRFVIQHSRDHGQTWSSFVRPNRLPEQHSNGESVFAASNGSMYLNDREYSVIFVTGGSGRSEIISGHFVDYFDTGGSIRFYRQSLPVTRGSQSAGAFSFAYRDCLTEIVSRKAEYCPVVVVGGDYLKPQKREGTAAYAQFSALLGKSEGWHEALTPPHGYRSAVQWGGSIEQWGDRFLAWITVGTNGSDISRDDGKTWQPIDNGNWNALSLPFVVGPNGRIARLNPAALAGGK